MYATCCPLPLFAVGACRVASGGLAIIREPSVQGKLRFSTYTVWHIIQPAVWSLRRHVMQELWTGGAPTAATGYGQSGGLYCY